MAAALSDTFVGGHYDRNPADAAIGKR